MDCQSPRVCQFCERSIDIKWKCYDCSLLLCELCKIKLHSKLSFRKVHKIVDIKHVTEDDITKKEKLDHYLTVPCDKHPSLFCCLFCTSCDSLVCPSCILEKHKNHSFGEISENFEMKKTSLEQIEKEITDDLIPEAQSDKKVINDLWFKKQSQYEQKSQAIENQRKNLVQIINTYSDKLLVQHTVFMKRLSEAFDRERNKLNSQEQCLLNKALSIKAVINSTNPCDIFSQASITRDRNELIKPSVTSLCSIVAFTAGKFSDEDKQLVFGSLLEARLLKSYITDLSDIGLVTSNNDTLWVVNKEMRILRQIRTGDGLQILRNIDDVEVSHFAVTKSGDLILKISKSNKLKLFSLDGRKRVYRDFSPLKPTCVHVLFSGDIAVGVKENGSNFVVSETSRRQLLVLSSSGKPKIAYEYENENERLFTYIWNLSSTESGDICVIDRLSDEFRGRLIMLEAGGKSKWMFNGQSENVFKPSDLVVTAAGNIIVSERLNHSLYILSASGILLVQIATPEMDIFLPQSLCTDSDGNIWLGCGTSKGEKNHAKLHKIRMSFLA